jgi:hypothetical protein
METNTIQIINQYSNNITELNISAKKINGILDLSKFTKLNRLKCSYNRITLIFGLSKKLIELNCSDNMIIKLNNLPENLIKLNCSNNKISNLDNLPLGLLELDCAINQIMSLDLLPNSLTKLDCKYNQINQLDNLPNRLIELNCKYNKITQLNDKSGNGNNTTAYYGTQPTLTNNVIHLNNGKDITFPNINDELVTLNSIQTL